MELTVGVAKVQGRITTSIHGINVSSTAESCLEESLVPILASQDQDGVAMFVLDIDGNSTVSILVHDSNGGDDNDGSASYYNRLHSCIIHSGLKCGHCNGMFPDKKGTVRYI